LSALAAAPAPARKVKAQAPKINRAVGTVSKIAGYAGGAIGGSAVGSVIAAITTHSLGSIAIAAVIGVVVGGMLGGWATGKIGNGIDDLTGGWLSKLAFTGFWGNGDGLFEGLWNKVVGKPPAPPPPPPEASSWTVLGTLKRVFWLGNVPPTLR